MSNTLLRDLLFSSSEEELTLDYVSWDLFLYSCRTIKGASSAEVKPCANLFPLCSSAPDGGVQQHTNGCNCYSCVFLKRGCFPRRTEIAVQNQRQQPSSLLRADCSICKLRRFTSSRRYDRRGTTHADQRRPH